MAIISFTNYKRNRPPDAWERDAYTMQDKKTSVTVNSWSGSTASRNLPTQTS